MILSFFAPRPVVIVSLITAFCLLGDSALYIVLPSRLEVFALTPVGAGLILGINRYIRIFSNRGAGWLFEWFGFYAPFISAILLAGLTTASYGLFIGFWPLFISHCLWGVSWSILRLGGYLVVIESAKEKSTGHLMGALQGISRIGSLVAVIFGGILSDTVGSRQTFVVFAFITLISIVLLPFGGVPRGLGHGTESSIDTKTGLSISLAQTDTAFVKIWTLYGKAAIVWLLFPGLMVGTVAYLVRTIVGEGIYLWGAFLGVGILSGSLVAVRWISDLTLGPLIGTLSDVLGRLKVILTSMVIAFFAFLVVTLNQSLHVVILSFIVAFLASTALQVSLNASIGDLAPREKRQAILSWYTTWADIGSGAGPLLGLPLVAIVGFSWVYSGATSLLVAAALMYVIVFGRSSNKKEKSTRSVQY